MVIMIISFRDKRTTDWLDQTDTRKRMSSSSFLVISFLFDNSFLTVLNINSLLRRLPTQLPTINRVPFITCHL